MRTARLIIGVILTSLLISVSEAKVFVPEAYPWPLWDSSDQSSSAVVDHATWQALLDAYLTTDDAAGINRFSYAQVTESDHERLRAYIEKLASLDPRVLSRAEQMAYWINLYNALTVELIVENYPVKSIRKIYGGLLNLGPWNEAVVEVAGQSLTLNDIEHRILRPVFRDPRVHYGVNCASLGCPNLSGTAYTGANHQRLLDAAGRGFVNHPRGVDFADGKLTVSSIYKWFVEDFGGSDSGVLEHLAGFAEPELAERLRQYTGRIKYAYDWTLNEP